MGDMTEFFSCLSAIIMASVFWGNFFFFGLLAFLDLTGDIIRALYKLIVKHFPNVRKTLN